MRLLYQLFTPSSAWGPPDSIALAINSQAGGTTQVEVVGDALRITAADSSIQVTARMLPFDAAAYQALTGQYPPRMTERDRTTALPFQYTVLLTARDCPATPEAALALVTIADGIWWMLGGFLLDPSAAVHWGWRAWRTQSTLPDHAATLLAAPAAALAPLTAPAGGSDHD